MSRKKVRKRKLRPSKMNAHLFSLRVVDIAYLMLGISVTSHEVAENLRSEGHLASIMAFPKSSRISGIRELLKTSLPFRECPRLQKMPSRTVRYIMSFKFFSTAPVDWWSCRLELTGGISIFAFVLTAFLDQSQSLFPPER